MAESYFIGNQLFNEFETATIEECFDYLSKQEVIAVDIETSRLYPKGTYPETVYKAGLDPYLSKICMIQVGTLEKRFIIDARVVDCKFLVPIFENENILKVGANLVFESLFFLHHLKCRLLNLYDVLLVDRILTNGLHNSYSLESLMKRYRGYKPPRKLTLFGDEDPELLILSLAKKKIENWVLLNGWTSDEKEFELYEEASEEINDLYVDKTIRMQFVELGDSPFTLEQIKYGETDITEPLLIREIFLNGRLLENEEGVEVYYPVNAIKMENKLITVIAEMIYHGVVLDPIKWMDVYESKKVKYNEMSLFLDKYVVENHPEFRGMLDLFTSEPECLIKWQSSKQVQKLFKKMDLVAMERSKATGKVSETVGAKALIKALKNEDKIRFMEDQFPEEITKGSDLVVAYLLFKKMQQVTTTYGKDFLNYIHPITKRVHCNIRQYLNTTRFAATRPNVLAIPRGKEYRDCFVAPKGMKVWACDYSTQELAVMGEMFNNKTLQSFFENKLTDPNADLHSWTATQVYRIVYNDPSFICDKKVHKKERQNAKILSFGIPYGMSAGALSQTLGTDIEEAEKFLTMYFESFPGLEEEFNKARKHAMKNGWIQICPFTDKRYFFRDFEKMNTLSKDALKYYPEHYRTFTPDQKKAFKEKLYEDYPEVKQYWREWSILKGILERRAINYKIQGSSATQTKASLIYMYNERYKSGTQKSWMPVLPIHDEVLGYYTNEQEPDLIHALMIKGAQYNCKHTPMFAEMAAGDVWIH